MDLGSKFSPLSRAIFLDRLSDILGQIESIKKQIELEHRPRSFRRPLPLRPRDTSLSPKRRAADLEQDDDDHDDDGDDNQDHGDDDDDDDEDDQDDSDDRDVGSLAERMLMHRVGYDTKTPKNGESSGTSSFGRRNTSQSRGRIKRQRRLDDPAADGSGAWLANKPSLGPVGIGYTGPRSEPPSRPATLFKGYTPPEKVPLAPIQEVSEGVRPKASPAAQQPVTSGSAMPTAGGKIPVTIETTKIEARTQIAAAPPNVGASSGDVDIIEGIDAKVEMVTTRVKTSPPDAKSRNVNNPPGFAGSAAAPPERPAEPDTDAKSIEVIQISSIEVKQVTKSPPEANTSSPAVLQTLKVKVSRNPYLIGGSSDDDDDDDDDDATDAEDQIAEHNAAAAAELRRRLKGKGREDAQEHALPKPPPIQFRNPLDAPWRKSFTACLAAYLEDLAACGKAMCFDTMALEHQGRLSMFYDLIMYKMKVEEHHVRTARARLQVKVNNVMSKNKNRAYLSRRRAEEEKRAYESESGSGNGNGNGKEKQVEEGEEQVATPPVKRVRFADLEPIELEG